MASQYKSQYKNQYDLYEQSQKANAKARLAARKQSANAEPRTTLFEMVGGAGNGYAMPAAIITEDYSRRSDRK